LTPDCLIIDPQVESRLRLMAAIKAVGVFAAVAHAGSLDDALSSIRDGGGVQLVFIAARFPRAALREFVAAAKANQNGRDAAYILLIQRNRAESLGAQLAEGFDALLIEPYSAEALVETAETAERVRRKNHERRLRIAFRLLVREIAAQHAQVADLTKQGAQAAVSRRILQEMCSVLGQLDSESLQIYFSELTEYMTELPAPGERQTSYRGASERVRRRCSEKVLSQLRQALNG